MTTESWSRLLCSPTFLSALFVLIANDRWLKGAGLLPAWLTGKLSDFAGLIVAPLLLVVLVRARTRRAQLACFGAVSFVFAALELSPELARVVEQVTRRVALNWRLWPDPTDLFALAVLPVGWRALRTSPPSRGTATALHKVVAGVAALACLGTSRNVNERTTAVALLNLTRDEVKVQLFRAEPIDCDLLTESPEEALTPRTFSLEACLKAKPFMPVPLDVDWSAPHDVGETPPPLDRRCDAVLLRAPGLADTVLFWNEAPKGEVLVGNTGGSPDGAEYVAFLENFGQELVLSPPAAIQSFVTDAGPPAAECPAEEP